MSVIDSTKLQTFFDRFPQLLTVIKKLNEQSIPWMIGGSGCLFLLGNDRSPDDVDMLLANDDHDRADALFRLSSFTYTSDIENVRNSNPFEDHDLQFTSHLQLTIEGKTYLFDYNAAVFEHAIQGSFEGEAVYLLPPEESLLVKALLQRGEDVGKHDVADIEKFMKIYEIDQDYMKKRIGELGAEERVGEIFNTNR
jgi:predicted nucleotidyltransferase